MGSFNEEVHIKEFLFVHMNENVLRKDNQRKPDIKVRKPYESSFVSPCYTNKSKQSVKEDLE